MRLYRIQNIRSVNHKVIRQRASLGLYNSACKPNHLTVYFIVVSLAVKINMLKYLLILSIANAVMAIIGDFVGLSLHPHRRPMFVPAGEPFNITCKGYSNHSIHGGAFTSMRWLDREGNVITDGDPRVEKDDENSVTLFFADPETGQNGLYKCRGSHHTQGYEISLLIYFYGPKPTFEEENVHLTAEESSMLEVVCSVIGDMPVVYEWEKDGLKISEDPNFAVYALDIGNQSTLTIRKVATSHEGSYICKATNEHGHSIKLYELKVPSTSGNETDDSATTPSISNVEVRNITSSSVEFSIDVSGSVRYIEVEYREINTNRHRRIQYFKHLTQWNYGDIYVVKGLNSSGVYTFQLRTVPSRDLSWSHSRTVTLLPDIPELIFESIKDGAIKVSWFIKVEELLKLTIDGYELKYFYVEKKLNEWGKSACAFTIQIPHCGGRSYTIAGGLLPDSHFEIQLRSHTVTGYGEPYTQKVYIPK